MGDGDGPDDGQAEAVAAVAADGPRAEPLEGLEQALDLGRGDDPPGAGHRQDGAGAAGPGGDLDVPAGDVVPDGVVDQVGHQLLDQDGVAVEGGGLDTGLDVQAQTTDRGAGGGQGFAGDGGQVGGLARGGAGFAAGQGEQRLDEVFGLGVGGEQFPADGLPGAGGGGRVGEGDLEQGAFPGQRGAQLVRGAGGEAPLGIEGGLQPGEQAVEGVAEFLELVIGAVQGQPVVQAAGGDPPGGGGHRAQRAQHPAGDDPAYRGGGHRDDRQGDGAGDQQQPLGVGDLRLGLRNRLSLLSGGQGRRLLNLLGEGDGNCDHVVATCLPDGGDGDLECCVDGADLEYLRQRGRRRARRIPEDQVGKREHGRAAGQERRTVQDGQAQPGSAAG
jgi:hypothetical protein